MIAQSSVMAGCLEPISKAETSFGIPKGLLAAIGSVESGLDPLAINADGISYHPKTVIDAVDLVRILQKAGAQFIDLGCMQIDLSFHPDAFATLADAFDPALNAQYGARVLSKYAVQFGSWATAVGRYHATDPRKQSKYFEQVSARLAGGGKGPRSDRRATTEDLSRARMVTVHLSFMTVRDPLLGDLAKGAQE
jgi:soluble lytic murein transglycosylase-like protein